MTPPRDSRAPPDRTDRARRLLLVANGLFLAGVGAVQVALELWAHFAGAGPLADAFYESAYTIGFVEAHGLAFVFGVVLIHAARRPAAVAPHLMASSVHVTLGGANLLFWRSFETFDLVKVGTAATVLHAVFIVAEGWAAARVGKRRQGPRPAIADDRIRTAVWTWLSARGFLFREAAAVLMGAGILLHASAIALGRTRFVEVVFTPMVDALVFLPLLAWTAIAAIPASRRYDLRPAWRKSAYWVVAGYIMISVPFHAQTLLQWSTDFVLGFPWWYSHFAILLQVAFLAVSATLRRVPAWSRGASGFASSALAGLGSPDMKPHRP